MDNFLCVHHAYNDDPVKHIGIAVWHPNEEELQKTENEFWR